MKELLIKKLHTYLVHNHLDLLIALQEDRKVTDYLVDKVSSVQPLIRQCEEEKRPDYVTEALCMDELTKDLRPSKFEYIGGLLEEEFSTIHWQLREAGTLTYEIINLIAHCLPVFSTLGFSEETENDPMLRNAIIGAIQDYLSN